MHSRRRDRKTQFSLKFCRNRISQQTNGFALKIDKGNSPRKKSGCSRNHRFLPNPSLSSGKQHRGLPSGAQDDDSEALQKIAKSAFYRILRCHRESNTEACHPALKTMTAKLYSKLLKFRRNRIFATNEWICIKNRQRGFAAKKNPDLLSMHWSMHSRRRERKTQFSLTFCRNRISQQTNGFALKIDKGNSPRKNPDFLEIIVFIESFAVIGKATQKLAIRRSRR